MEWMLWWLTPPVQLNRRRLTPALSWTQRSTSSNRSRSMCLLLHLRRGLHHAVCQEIPGQKFTDVKDGTRAFRCLERLEGESR